MKIMIVTLLLLFSSSVIAQRDLLNFIERTQEQVQNLLNANPNVCHLPQEHSHIEQETETSDSPPISVSPFATCIQSICGREASYQTSREMVLSTLNESNYSQFLPQANFLRQNLEQYFQNRRQEILQNIPKIQAWLRTGDFTLNPLYQKIIYATYAFNSFSHLNLSLDNITVNHDDQTLIFQRNQEQIAQDLEGHVPEQMRERFANFFHTLLHQPSFARLLYMNYNDSVGLLRNNFPGMSLLNIAEALRTELISDESQINSYFNLPVSVIDFGVNHQLLNLMRERVYVTEDSLSKLLSTRLTIGSILASLDTPSMNHLAEIPITQLINAEEMLAMASEISSNVLDYTEEKRNTENAVITYCQTIYAQRLASLPTQRELSRYEQQFALLKERIKSRISSRFSETTQNGLNAYIDQVELSLPPTQEIFHEYFENILATVQRDNNNQPSLDGIDPQIQNQVERVQLASFALSLSNFDENQSLSDILSTCEDMAADTTLGDAAYVGHAGAIRISWQSIKSPNFGVGVLAHELGHSLEMYFQNNNVSTESFQHFGQSRNCLTNNQQDLASRNRIIERTSPQGNWEESLYASENFADEVAALIGPNQNFGCFLMSPISVAEGYYHSPDSTDPHAPLIQRLLRIQSIQNGRLPRTCDRVLSAQNITPRLGGCINRE